MKIIIKSFPGHKGRPGQRGGSLPRSGSSVASETVAKPEEEYDWRNPGQPTLDRNSVALSRALNQLNIKEFVAANVDKFKSYGYVPRDPNDIRTLALDASQAGGSYTLPDGGHVTIKYRQNHWVTGKFVAGTAEQQRYDHQVIVSVSDPQGKLLSTDILAKWTAKSFIRGEMDIKKAKATQYLVRLQKKMHG